MWLKIFHQIRHANACFEPINSTAVFNQEETIIYDAFLHEIYHGCITYVEKVNAI